MTPPPRLFMSRSMRRERRTAAITCRSQKYCHLSSGTRMIVSEVIDSDFMRQTCCARAGARPKGKGKCRAQRRCATSPTLRRLSLDRQAIRFERWCMLHVEISILDLAVRAGTVPPRVLGLIMEWASMHKEELLQNWESARNQQPLTDIRPLE
jgi:hypothetical protein